MSEWAAKRFWKTADITPYDNGFGIVLDDRPVKTPAKAPLVVPTEVMARSIASEWDAQDEKINPLTMPVTRSANAAIDKVATQKAEVVDMLAAYGDSDLLCYRAVFPEELVRLQRENWDPILDWAATALKAPLVSVDGVIHVPQETEILMRLHGKVAEQTEFQLAGFHDLVSMSGSLVLALAVTHDRLNAADAWTLSRVDENYQISQWGADDEAEALAETKRVAFSHAAQFYQMCLT